MLSVVVRCGKMGELGGIFVARSFCGQTLRRRENDFFAWDIRRHFGTSGGWVLCEYRRLGAFWPPIGFVSLAVKRGREGVGNTLPPINGDVAPAGRDFGRWRNGNGDFSKEFEKDFLGLGRVRNGGAQRTII
jgi:hypothetical protein